MINDIITQNNHFAANLLSEKQLRAGMHFAQKLSSDLGYDQFEGFDYDSGIQG